MQQQQHDLTAPCAIEKIKYIYRLAAKEEQCNICITRPVEGAQWCIDRRGYLTSADSCFQRTEKRKKQQYP